MTDSDTQHVFNVNVPLPRAQARGPCECVILARSRAGDIRREEFSLVIDPDSPLPVTVTSGPTLSSHAYAQAHPPLVLYVERAVIDRTGHLLVHGWAVSLNPLVTVQAFIDDERIDAAQLGGQRDDIGTAFPRYPNARHAGFMLSKRVGVPAGRVTAIRVQAISRSGFMHEVLLPVEQVRALATDQPVPDLPTPLPVCCSVDGPG